MRLSLNCVADGSVRPAVKPTFFQVLYRLEESSKEMLAFRPSH